MQFTAKRRGRCCNFSVDVALKVRFTTTGMCAKSNTQIYVTWTSNNGVISSGDLYYCLLPQCEALRMCRSSFFYHNTRNIVSCLSHAWYMKMARDEYVLGFKSCDISIYWLVGCYYFCLKRFGLEFIIFFLTLSQLSVQFWDYRLLQDRRLTVDCSHLHVGSHLLHNAASPWANQRSSRTDDPQHHSNCNYIVDQVHSSIAATNSTLHVAQSRGHMGLG